MPLRQFIETRPPKYSFATKYQLEGMSIQKSVATFDYVGRFENLAETCRFLQTRLGIPAVEPPHTNSTGVSRYQDDYDAATIALVRGKFAVDLSLFGYDYEC
jgi:hypothetical protein